MEFGHIEGGKSHDLKSWHWPWVCRPVHGLYTLAHWEGQFGDIKVYVHGFEHFT